MPTPPTRPSAASVRLERIEERFREIEDRRGYEAASEWWDERAWPTYYERCVRPVTMAITNIDERKLEAFIGLAATELGAALNAALVTLGDELGLYRAMADGQPVAPAELAARTGTQERYVREWLNAQAASGFVVYDAEAAAYVLPPEHALVLADESSPFLMTGSFQAANAAVAARERAAPSASSTARASAGTSTITASGTAPSARSRSATARTCVAEWLPALDGVVAKLEAGARVADVGCGHGASTILMAQAFPASRFVGIDYHAGLDRDGAAARRAGGRRRPA